MDPNSNTQTFDMQPNILNILGHDSIPEPERISDTKTEVIDYIEDEWDNIHGDLIIFR